jgi:hypothetical protein
MPRNKSFALECRATKPTRWNAAQEILRTKMPRNKSYTIECRTTNPSRWNAAQQILRAGMPRNKSSAKECPANFPKEHMQDGDLVQRRQKNKRFVYITWT